MVGTVTCRRLGKQSSWLSGLQSMNPNEPWPPGSRPVRNVVHAVDETDGSDECIETRLEERNNAARFGSRPAAVSVRSQLQGVPSRPSTNTRGPWPARARPSSGIASPSLPWR
jgi:hypothetical protein